VVLQVALVRPRVHRNPRVFERLAVLRVLQHLAEAGALRGIIDAIDHC
jgi:hypothetical protein